MTARRVPIRLRRLDDGRIEFDAPKSLSIIEADFLEITWWIDLDDLEAAAVEVAE